MIDIKKFRKANNLTQSEVGDYLGIKKSYFSLIESGHKNLSDEKLSKLLENPYGWDVSMLVTRNIGDNNVTAQVNGNGTAHIEYGGDECALLREKVKYLEKIIEEKERLIGVLLERK